MQQYPFIFSDARSYRIKRHLCFWLVWWIFQGFLYSFVAINSGTAYWVRLQASFAESFIYLVPHMFLTYALMYFIIPRYVIKQFYLKAVSITIVLFLITAAVSSLLSVTLIPYVREEAMKLHYEGPPRSTTMVIFLGLMAGLRGAITIAGIGSTIKLMKFWYLKEQRNLQLQKENVATQLQLLKAQIHPHFLFNTLNNIFSYTQETAPKAAQLVAGLSDMLRYMLYDCNQSLTPLHKEIKLLQDYCSLEKVRYDAALDLQLSVPEKNTALYISPLLLLPFVENCFKHGASNQVDNAWISISITTEGSRMKMKVVNSKSLEEAAAGYKAGIGIANVKTRLELLYPGRYELSITNEPEVFIVKLSLQLDGKPATTATPAVQKMLTYEQQ